MLDHKEKFVDVFEELLTQTEFIDIGCKSKREEFKNSFKIFCYDRYIINGILAMEKIDGVWRLRHSWRYLYDDWMYTSGLIQINAV